MKTSTAKIARLSKGIRHQLSLRIEDNQPGTDLVAWLNSLPQVQEILKLQFESRPITEQNLSAWKQSGHLNWLRQQEARQSALDLLESADDFSEVRLSDQLAIVLASELSQLAMSMFQEETDKEKKWQRLCQINKELSRLRRDDHRAVTAKVQEERWGWEFHQAKEQDRDRQEKEHREKMIKIMLEGRERAENAKYIFGGGETGRERAEMLYRLRCGLPIDDLLDASERKEEEQTSDPADAPAQSAQPESAKTPAKVQKSSPVQPAKGEKESNQPADPVPHKNNSSSIHSSSSIPNNGARIVPTRSA